MARVTWTGSVSFGLVNIPVKMYTAVRDHTIRFHRLTEDGSCRLRTKLYCPETDEEYDFSQTARGYEVAPDQYVLVSDEELEGLRPDHGHAIEIEDFVSLHEIDPVFYERPYYLAPDERGTRPYALLVDAMTKTERVGIARFVLRDKQHLAALRVSQGGLCLSTMRWKDEVQALTDVTKLPTDKADPRQVKLAIELIDALTRPFEPERYRDTFRDEVMGLIEAKAKGERIPVAAEPEPRGEVVDLMDALKKSLGASASAPRAAVRKPRERDGDAEEAATTTTKKKKAPARKTARKAPARKAPARKATARKKAAAG